MDHRRDRDIVSGVLSALISLGAPGVLAAALSNSSSAVSSSATIGNDGIHTFSDGAGSENWVTPANTTVAAYYEVRVDVTAGSFTSGTTGTWLACSSNRSWTKLVVGSVSYDLSLRLTNGPTLRTYSLTMTVT